MTGLNVDPSLVYKGITVVGEAADRAEVKVTLPNIDFLEPFDTATTEWLELFTSLGSVVIEVGESGVTVGSRRRAAAFTTALCMKIGGVAEEAAPQLVANTEAILEEAWQSELKRRNETPQPVATPEHRNARNLAENANTTPENARNPSLGGIGRYRLLTNSEVKERMQRYEAGRKAKDFLAGNEQIGESERCQAQQEIQEGTEAWYELYTSNLRLVVSIARRFHRLGIALEVELEDLVQWGNVGLANGIPKFDWKKGYAFSTYMQWWIRQGIQRGARNTGRAIRLPAIRAAECKAVDKYLSGNQDLTLYEAWESTRSEDELKAVKKEKKAQQRLLEAYEQFCDAWSVYNGLLSLNRPLDDREDAELGDIIVSEVAVEEAVVHDMLLDRLREALESIELTDREQEIVKRRFLSENDQRATLVELAVEWGVSHQTVGRFEHRLIAKLASVETGLNPELVEDIYAVS